MHLSSPKPPVLWLLPPPQTDTPLGGNDSPLCCDWSLAPSGTEHQQIINSELSDPLSHSAREASKQHSLDIYIYFCNTCAFCNRILLLTPIAESQSHLQFWNEDDNSPFIIVHKNSTVPLNRPASHRTRVGGVGRRDSALREMVPWSDITLSQWAASPTLSSSPSS